MQVKKKKTTTVIEEITVIVKNDYETLNLNKEKEFEIAERLLEQFERLHPQKDIEIVTRT